MTSASDLKDHIHQLVLHTEDTSILKQIVGYITALKQNNEKDWWEELTPQQKELIFRGQRELAEGNRVPFFQVKEKALKIINKNRD